MGRSHDGEVSMVERGDPGLIVMLGSGDEAGVDETKPEVGVGVDEIYATLVEGGGEIDDGDSSSCAAATNADSAALPRRDSIIHAVSATTGPVVASSSRLTCSRWLHL